MQVDGTCHCGNIAFRAEIDPEKVKICHCADCQTFSGSAFRISVPAVEGSFELLSGSPKTYIKTGESGSKRVQGFCGDCGTAIYSANPGDGVAEVPKRYTLRIGTLRQRATLRPASQIWYRSAVAWLTDLPSLRRVEKQ
ncbi:MAG: GFA family protein [Dongiaceae bacterium]